MKITFMDSVIALTYSIDINRDSHTESVSGDVVCS